MSVARESVLEAVVYVLKEDTHYDSRCCVEQPSCDAFYQAGLGLRLFDAGRYCFKQFFAAAVFSPCASQVVMPV